MFEYKKGNVLDEDAEALVNTVNCVGVMGRGVALQFKKAFPRNFKDYSTACRRKEVQPGRMFVFETGSLTNPRFIINFPTKRHWRGKSRMEDIDSGLSALVDEIRAHNIRSIAIPSLGSGLGGLNWREVRPRIEDALRNIHDLRVVLFEPGDAPASMKLHDVPAMTVGRAVLVVLLDRYMRALMEPFVSLLEAHKLMYFMQEAGEPLHLQFEKELFGPYAENLRHDLHSVEGHLISGYEHGSNNPRKRIELVPGATKDAEAFLAKNSDIGNRLERVARLIRGFETPFGLELLATVHWVATREGALRPEEAVAKVYAWNERKKRFNSRQIEVALRSLQREKWVDECGLQNDKWQGGRNYGQLNKPNNVKKAKSFVDGRRDKVKKGEVWKPLSKGPYAVLHWIPVSERKLFDYESMSDENFSKFIRMTGRGVGELNSEGIQYRFYEADEVRTGEEGLRQRPFWNAQIFRSGALEMAIALSFHVLPEIEGKWIQEYTLVKDLRTAMNGFRKGLSSMSITDSIVVGVSILFAEHCGLLTETFPPATRPYTENEDLNVAEQLIEDYRSEQEFVEVERQIFDHLCIGFGLKKCSYYEQGNRVYII